jgi:mannose-1-phosphate guanylyltransferase
MVEKAQMPSHTDTWALVLAAGEGSRLRALTTAASGTTIPKQFCSLHDGPSLLHEALCRAGAVASNQRTCSVVAAQHRGWWETALESLPTENIFVQPKNRGTAHGILLPLLSILERDPKARLVILPSDHHVRDEAIMSESLRRASVWSCWRHDEMLLLGMNPEEADPELGYIVPGRSASQGALNVERFIEKPTREEAQTLLALGALWNAFIVATTAQALLATFRRRMADSVFSIRNALRQDRDTAGAAQAVAALYEQLPDRDFSRHVLHGEELHLHVLPVPSCGWSDLGTPKRIAEVLQRFSQPARNQMFAARGPVLSLAAQHSRLQVPRLA